MDFSTASLERLFRLKPMRSARVSEISEATAASPIPADERVNLHIGNPLQDSRLRAAYLRLAFGLDPDQDPKELGWTDRELKQFRFFEQLIQKAAPYTPRGGFSIKDPNSVIKTFAVWLEEQQEPLDYDLGQQSGRREVVLATGGVLEATRVLLHALSQFLAVEPGLIAVFRLDLPEALKELPRLQLHDLPHDEATACECIESLAKANPDRPLFVLLGEVPSEESRRRLLELSSTQALFFIEANDAPNHHSLAREAKLTQRVLRLLTPGVLSSRLRDLATIFVAGNADFLSIFESMHFQLKGSPSATEIELLSFLLENAPPAQTSSVSEVALPAATSFHGLGWDTIAEDRLPALAASIEGRLTRILESGAQRLERQASHFAEKATNIEQRLQRRVKSSRLGQGFDAFAHLNAHELLNELAEMATSSKRRAALEESYINVFVKHQPQYQAGDCLVVSGSARTALGLLGFHCGITEVLVPDLSWTYEHCFPKVHTVPLTPDFELDAGAMIADIQRRLEHDSMWRERGAVAINNPHNATGKVFDETAIRHLVSWLLSHDVFVIDDLSYQNVVPRDEIPSIKTVRDHATELVRMGAITERQADRVVTVHSMSKTDCQAGSRLSVVEIRHRPLREKLQKWNSCIVPNLGAIALSYLFYRQDRDAVRNYWRIRNRLFGERSQALVEAVSALPDEANPFDIRLIPPSGSMYPLLQIRRLPSGLSLDWLASGLARQGIGMLPLATFARTEEGFDAGRTTFRLTLGGSDDAEVLLKKMRRVLIDLNRRISEEAAHYNRRALSGPQPRSGEDLRRPDLEREWHRFEEWVIERCRDREPRFVREFLPERLSHFRVRLLDRVAISEKMVQQARSDGGKAMAAELEREFMKDSLARRQAEFAGRLYDRTVHPTQMYALRVEQSMDAVISALIHQNGVGSGAVDRAAVDRAVHDLWQEFLGLNVAISSREEAQEILLDLDTLIAAEHHARLFSGRRIPSLISFWSDWDGSNRPSGQGHQLVASVVMTNVNRMANLMELVRRSHGNAGIEPSLLAVLDRLPEHNRRLTRLLGDITSLTHQLEARYRGILPFSLKPTSLRRLGMKLRVTEDPLKTLWKHNDRYERKMLDLRRQRHEMLEFYFELNKRLRKQLHALIPVICSNPEDRELILAASWYRDLLQRVVITPRVQQSQVTAKDQFAIDTTVHNLFEINEISGKYGNPGLVLALQVSMSSHADALISLDRKMGAKRDHLLRSGLDAELPHIRTIPLFEDLDSVQGIPAYLSKVWDHALQSRRSTQEPRHRFAEIMCEVFIAGSDLSQQVGQAPAAGCYRKAKHEVHAWLAERRLTDKIRMKLGSGEPMQRQGGYYSPYCGIPAFSSSPSAIRCYLATLPADARKSTQHAITPLTGVFSGGDLRTFQSNLSEHLRRLPSQDLVDLIFHVQNAQQVHREDLLKAAEALAESRSRLKSRSAQNLERLTLGQNEPLYHQFLQIVTENFRQILYGREEDVAGLHVVAYFIARSMPQLRDRPTVRRTLGVGAERGSRILSRISEVIPQSRHGSMLRAIAHNQAQTAMLGVNQLTTGLFRALDQYSRKAFSEGQRSMMISERILPHLPVHEILASLRLYHDPGQELVREVEGAFPAANSAFVALREDVDAMRAFLPLFQQELLRRHGVDVGKFFIGDSLIPDLIPTLRPDLAVLLQPDLFNTELELMMRDVSYPAEDAWKAEVASLLQVPEKIRTVRKQAWSVLGDSVVERAKIFTELAVALQSLPPGSLGASGKSEAPVSIIRAMQDVERIAAIEEHAFPKQTMDLLRGYQVQIARLAGDNG